MTDESGSETERDVGDEDIPADQHRTVQERIAEISLPVLIATIVVVVLVAGLIGFAARDRFSSNTAGRGNDTQATPVNARVVGTISAVRKSAVVVTDTHGAPVIVNLGPQSLIMTARYGKPSDIVRGARTLVLTSKDTQATRVILVPADTPVGKFIQTAQAGAIRFEGPVRKNRKVSTVGAIVNVATPAPVRAIERGVPVAVFGTTRGALFGGLRASEVSARVLVVLP